jgi:4-hydroxybenzoate polyprenyltransferase
MRGENQPEAAHPEEGRTDGSAESGARGEPRRMDEPDSPQRVLCVDLDGTLVATDMLWEGIFAMLRERPTAVLQLPRWLLKGKAYFKQQVAERAPLCPETLPYRDDVLQFLQQEHAAGREIVLATAADQRIACAIASHFPFFSGVIASDGAVNLSGPRKCCALDDRYGAGLYDYIGNGHVDLPMWKSANKALLAAPPSRLVGKVKAMVPVEAVFSPRQRRLHGLLMALRPHQWIKNILVFVPVLLDHKLLNMPVLIAAVLAFLAFSLAASGAYVLNDILDIDADRKHPVKRHRPFAAGTLSIATGVTLLPLLLLSSLAIALTLPRTFLALLVSYVILTTAYSVYLKSIPVLDVILLAGLYTLRVLGGIAATNVRFSAWLLGFSMFLFLSLAFMKRYAEINKSGKGEQDLVARRGYMGVDLEWLRSMGGSSGYMAVLVLALYISSEEVTVLYRHPELLWLICPLLLYWISRMWFRTHRGKLDEDPIVATAQDPLNYAIGAVVVVILFAAL